MANPLIFPGSPNGTRTQTLRDRSQHLQIDLQAGAEARVEFIFLDNHLVLLDYFTEK